MTVEEGKNLPHHFCLTTPVNFNWLISPSQPVIGQSPVPVRFNWPQYGCCQDALLYPCDFVRTGTEDTEEVVSLFASRDRSWTVVGSGTDWHWRENDTEAFVILESLHTLLLLSPCVPTSVGFSSFIISTAPDRRGTRHQYPPLYWNTRRGLALLWRDSKDKRGSLAL